MAETTPAGLDYIYIIYLCIATILTVYIFIYANTRFASAHKSYTPPKSITEPHNWFTVNMCPLPRRFSFVGSTLVFGVP